MEATCGNCTARAFGACIPGPKQVSSPHSVPPTRGVSPSWPDRVLQNAFFLKVTIIVMNFMLEYLHFKFVNKFCWASRLYNALCEVGITRLLHHCILDDRRHQGRLILAAYVAFHHCVLSMSYISSWPLDSGSVKQYHPQRLHGWPASQNGKLGPERELQKPGKYTFQPLP